MEYWGLEDHVTRLRQLGVVSEPHQSGVAPTGVGSTHGAHAAPRWVATRAALAAAGGGADLPS